MHGYGGRFRSVAQVQSVSCVWLHGSRMSVVSEKGVTSISCGQVHGYGGCQLCLGMGVQSIRHPVTPASVVFGQAGPERQLCPGMRVQSGGCVQVVHRYGGVGCVQVVSVFARLITLWT